MKIFGIGVARTGTTTLAKALDILGFKSAHVECNVMEVDGDSFSINNDVLENNEAIVGTPLSPCFELLADRYPDALFILTIRDYKGWLRSCSISFTESLAMDENHKALHRWLYDSILYDREKFLVGYSNYVLSVLNYFYKSKKLLFVYNICAGLGWKPLCDFVGKPIPDIPFPHESKRGALLKND